MPTPAPSARTQVRRLPERGAYDRTTIASILDAGFLCHVAFVHEGAPAVIPTAYGRRADEVYFHGSAASRMLRTLASGAECCFTTMVLDGLVLARAVFHHSMNYRSVVIYGRPRVIEAEAEKLAALETITEQIAPGRWPAARLPTAQELKATLVLALPITEASAKVRSGGPKDEPEDYALPIWAGVVPARLVFGPPQSDAKLEHPLAPPRHASRAPQVPQAFGD